MISTAALVPKVEDEEERDEREAPYDQNLFEGDIEITLDEIMRYYGGPKLDEPEHVGLQYRYDTVLITMAVPWYK